MRKRAHVAWKAAVIFLSCVIASYVTVTRHGGLFGVGGSRALLAQPRRERRTPDPNFDLTRMTVMRRVMLETYKERPLVSQILETLDHAAPKK